MVKSAAMAFVARVETLTFPRFGIEAVVAVVIPAPFAEPISATHRHLFSLGVSEILG